MRELFSRRYDVRPELLLDFLQQAMTTMPTIRSFGLGDDGDRIEFETSFTWTSWGEQMIATVQGDAAGGAILAVSGQPRLGLASTPWGEELHAATIESQLRAAMELLIESARTNPVLML